ncbi:hypothetical protein CWB57_18540, partial [Pseudoalteromonas sp. S186]
ISKHQLNALDNDFKQLSPAQQTQQLNHLYESALRMSSKYHIIQNVATRILEINNPPATFINHLKNTYALTFFNNEITDNLCIVA